MSLSDSITISYQDAEFFSEEVLRRWLLWALGKESPEYQEMVLRTVNPSPETESNKQDILCALVWVGAIG